MKIMFGCYQEEVIWFLSEGLIYKLEMYNLLSTSLGNTCIPGDDFWLFWVTLLSNQGDLNELQFLPKATEITLNPGYAPLITPQTEPREFPGRHLPENQNGRLPIVQPKMLCLTLPVVERYSWHIHPFQWSSGPESCVPLNLRLKSTIKDKRSSLVTSC